MSSSSSNRHELNAQVGYPSGRREAVNSIEDAQERWQNIRVQGRKKGFLALAVIIVILLALGFAAKNNAGIVVAVVVAAVVVVGAVAIMLGKKQTGLSITPEWKPKTERAWEDDDDDDAGNDSAAPPRPVGASAPEGDDVEPIRRLDAQILGTDLSRLGQVVDPKLAKSYAMGYLDLADGTVSWQPSVVTTAKGIDPLESAPAEVASVERTSLWGSWALIRVVRTDGTEWCMRVPGSVDLAPAFGDLGLTLQTVGD